MGIRELNDFGVGDLNGTAIMETLNKAYKGKADITLSNYDNDSAPVVKIGSVFDNNGAIFLIETVDEIPTGYSGIANSTIFYLYYDESAGVFIYSAIAPAWNDAFQGWYNGNDRALFSMFKDSGGTLYEGKSIILQKSRYGDLVSGSITEKVIGSGVTIQASSGENVKTLIASAITTGASSAVNIFHSITRANIRGISVAIDGTYTVTSWQSQSSSIFVGTLETMPAGVNAYATITYI